MAIIEGIGKYVGGKVVTAICFVASAGAVIYFYRNPDDLKDIWTVVKYGIAWIAFAVVMPWGAFALLPRILKADSNATSALLLCGLTGADILMALWLCGWSVGGALAWSVLLLGFIAAGAYNFVVCESLARHIEGS
ncbi:MAG: hypothetical protein V3T70_06340 [Phycisphaerae bacterium]